MKWNIAEPNEEAISQYSQNLKISPLFASVLINRGLTLEDTKSLLEEPFSLLEDPYKIYGAEKVADLIISYMENNKTFFIFADYDVDGMTSGFVFTDFLRQVGAEAYPYYPEREEGYGLSVAFANRVVNELKEEYDCVVITVDNGITALEPVDILNEHNVPVIIIDHHEPGDVLPNCPCCDPWIDRGVGTHLACVAVAWKVALIIEDKLIQKGKIKKRVTDNYLSYVGIGTVSDVMPMTTENRALVKKGLEHINKDVVPAIATLRNVFSLQEVKAKDIAWTIAPKLNSPSRLGRTDISVQIFFESDPDSLEDMAVEIGRKDNERKSISEKAIKDVLKKNDFDKYAVCFYDASEYPHGIAGILAGRIAETFNKPAVVYHKDGEYGRCSCRTANGIDIKALLNSQKEKDLLVGAAGHAMACGATLYLDKIPELKKSITKELRKMEKNGEIIIAEPELTIDKVIEIKDITPANNKELNLIPYTGDEPIFCIRNVKVEILRPFMNQEHIVFKITDEDNTPVYAISWNGYNTWKHIQNHSIVDIAASFDVAKYSARTLKLKQTDIVLMLKDIKQAGEE